MEITIIIIVGLWIAYCKYFSGTPKVNIELVPYQAHGMNVRSRLTNEQWRKVCTVVHKKNNPNGRKYRCQQCQESGQSQGFEHPVECHEIWHFDDKRCIQKLVGMLSICPMCHKAKHLGLAKKMGFGERAKQHMAKHNGWSMRQVENYVAKANQLVKKRNGNTYSLDLTYLNKKEFSFLNTRFTQDERANCNNDIKY